MREDTFLLFAHPEVGEPGNELLCQLEAGFRVGLDICPWLR